MNAIQKIGLSMLAVCGLSTAALAFHNYQHQTEEEHDPGALKAFIVQQQCNVFFDRLVAEHDSVFVKNHELTEKWFERFLKGPDGADENFIGQVDEIISNYTVGLTNHLNQNEFLKYCFDPRLEGYDHSSYLTASAYSTVSVLNQDENGEFVITEGVLLDPESGGSLTALVDERTQIRLSSKGDQVPDFKTEWNNTDLFKNRKVDKYNNSEENRQSDLYYYVTYKIWAVINAKTDAVHTVVTEDGRKVEGRLGEHVPCQDFSRSEWVTANCVLKVVDERGHLNHPALIKDLGEDTISADVYIREYLLPPTGQYYLEALAVSELEKKES
jgi:hypothetical protein